MTDRKTKGWRASENRRALDDLEKALHNDDGTRLAEELKILRQKDFRPKDPSSGQQPLPRQKAWRALDKLVVLFAAKKNLLTAEDYTRWSLTSEELDLLRESYQRSGVLGLQLLAPLKARIEITSRTGLTASQKRQTRRDADLAAAPQAGVSREERPRRVRAGRPLKPLTPDEN